MEYRIVNIKKDKIVQTFDNEYQLISFLNTQGLMENWYIEVFKPCQYEWKKPR